MREWTDLLKRAYLEWSAAHNHDFLGLGEDFDHECPPLLIMGGSRIASDASPLVVVSLEPLTDGDHYERQCAFASFSEDNHRRWNLDYFDVFPSDELAGKTPQPYWKSMYDVVAGHCGTQEPFSWRVLAGNYIEVPAIPVHAAEHPAVRMEQFRESLYQRLGMIRTQWPQATFLALGRATLGALGLQKTDGEKAFEFPDRDRARAERFGAIWSAPMLRFALQIGGETLPLYWRYVFSYNYRCKPDGRRWLGEALRRSNTGE